MIKKISSKKLTLGVQHYAIFMVKQKNYRI